MVRNKFAILLFFLTGIALPSLITSCSGSEQEDSVCPSYFQVRRDTIELDAIGWPKKCIRDQRFNLFSLCKYKGNYILEFEDARGRYDLMSLSGNLKRMKFFSELPHFWEMPNNELFVRNDSLLRTASDNDFRFYHYYNSKKRKWEELPGKKKKRSLQFERFGEDEQFFINISRRIEGLDFTLFEDKKTSAKHAFYSFCVQQVLKYKGRYYLFNPWEIKRVNDVKRGTYNDSLLYVYNYCCPLELSLEGERLEWSDTLAAYDSVYQSLSHVNVDEPRLDADTLFMSGLVIQDTLYVLAKDQKGNFIAKYENDSLKRVFDFELGTTGPWHDWGFGRNPSDHQFLLPIGWWQDSEEKWRSGFIDINGYDIHIVYLKY